MPKKKEEVMTKGKKCFVISPIGSDGSDVRRRADQVYKHIICPPLGEAGYEAVRADKISDPGMITSQVIEHVVSDDLVIADLTGHNPNVFYELAVRHAVGKPFIQLIDHEENIPFDIASFRTILFDYKDLDSAAQAKEQISAQIESIDQPDFKLVTPLNFTVDMKTLQTSGDREELYISKIFDVMSGIQSQLNQMDRRVSASEYNQKLTHSDLGVYDRYDISTSKGQEWSEDRVRLLVDMWGDGFSATEIGKALGGISRASVLGKIHRLGLSSSGKRSKNTSAEK